MGFRFIIKLKYESSTIILLVSIRYSMRDLLSDLNNHDPQTSHMRQIRQMMLALSLSSAFPPPK